MTALKMHCNKNDKITPGWSALISSHEYLQRDGKFELSDPALWLVMVGIYEPSSSAEDLYKAEAVINLKLKLTESANASCFES